MHQAPLLAVFVVETAEEFRFEGPLGAVGMVRKIDNGRNLPVVETNHSGFAVGKRLRARKNLDRIRPQVIPADGVRVRVLHVTRFREADTPFAAASRYRLPQ